LKTCAKHYKYAHSKIALRINQAHGSPANILDPYAAFDIPEPKLLAQLFSIPAYDERVLMYGCRPIHYAQVCFFGSHTLMENLLLHAKHVQGLTEPF
jgi:hypothetical protein